MAKKKAKGLSRNSIVAALLAGASTLIGCDKEAELDKEFENIYTEASTSARACIKSHCRVQYWNNDDCAKANYLVDKADRLFTEEIYPRGIAYDPSESNRENLYVKYQDRIFYLRYLLWRSYIPSLEKELGFSSHGNWVCREEIQYRFDAMDRLKERLETNESVKGTINANKN